MSQASLQLAPMRFFEFNQNNSGGSFDYNVKSGITEYVIVEALNESHANARAEELGIYFNGCESGTDCSCCGDRWYRAYGEGDEVPSHYGTPLTVFLEGVKPTKRSIPPVAIHYADGTFKWAKEPEE